MCQQQDAVLRFPFALRQEVLHASVGPWVAALEGSQHWQYLLSSAPVPSYSMLGILSDIFWQFTLRKALHSMLTKSMKLQPSSSSSAKGHTGKHEERARHHEDLLALWVAFNAEAMHQPHVLCPCSNLSTCCDPFSPKPFSSKNQASNGKKSPLLHLLLLVLHELSRWQQRYENELTSWSFQTLAFAMIWNCWKRAPLLKCSDTVCLSSIKTSKNPGTSKTCATCKSLRGLAFLDPRPRWNHRSSTCLSNTPALNIAKSHPIPCISATFSNIDVVYQLTDRTYVLGHTLAITTLQTKVTTGRLLLKRIEDHKEQICCLRMHDLFENSEYSAWCNVCQQQDAVLRFPFVSWQEVLRASVEPWVAALEGSQHWQYLLSSAPVPSYSMLGILSDIFWQFTLRNALHSMHTKLLKQARNRAPQRAIQGSMRNMQGTMRICWLFGLPSMQKLCTNLMCFVHVPISQHAATRSPQNPSRQRIKRAMARKSLASSFAAFWHGLWRWPQDYATFSNIDVVYQLTDRTYVLGHTLAITALQTKVTTGRLLLIRIEDHKEQICCLSRWAWLVWEFRVFSMVQRVPAAGRCPTIPFCIVTRSLACFCRALGCCVRRLTTLAISAFICPCPKLQYAWDSFWHFLTIHPSQRTAQHAHQITEAGT